MGTLAACCLRLPHKARDAADAGADLNGQKVLTEMMTEHVGDTLAQRATAEVHQLSTVVVEREADVGIDEDDTLEGREDVVQLRGVGLEELPTRGYIIKYILHLEVAAHRTGGRFLTDHLRGGEAEARADVVGRRACEQLDLRHGGDGGQGLATEAHGMEGEEVVGLADLRGGMALEGQTGIGLGHAAAVVDDLDGRATGIDNDDIDDGGTGINGILDQLLDDGSRTLDDLASRYLVGDAIREKTYNVTHRFLGRQLKISILCRGRTSLYQA